MQLGPKTTVIEWWVEMKIFDDSKQSLLRHAKYVAQLCTNETNQWQIQGAGGPAPLFLAKSI